MEAADMANSALTYHPDYAELIYRHVCYLYSAGFLEESYQQLAVALEKDASIYRLMFDIIPGLENDPRIQQIIQQKIL